MMLIEARNLTKYYGSLRALDNVSLSVREGEIFGIFGPNGAGKSTTVRVLSGLTRFDSGSAYVCDVDVGSNMNGVRRHVAILMEMPFLYESMNSMQYLRFFGRLSGIPRSELPSRVNDVLGFLEMQDMGRKRISQMSSGQRQRLELARVMLGNARILFLDEPFTMIDISMRRKLRGYLKDWCREGRCIFYTSHNIIESEYIVDRFSFISEGRIRAVGGARDLMQKLLVPKFYLEVSDTERAYFMLKNQNWVSTIDRSGNGLNVGLKNRYDVKYVAPMLVRANIEILEMKGLGTMEDVFDRVMR